jgi:GNAT superfamily N-acetyltransferase
MTHIRPMTAADLPAGLRLSRQAGWNQLAADWQRFLDLQPDGCFVAEWAGNAAGTTVTSIFGSVAWVALVLVDESLRGCGIGTALLHHTLGFLDQRRVPTIRLDATPLGRPLYEQLGFAPQFQLARHTGTLPPTMADTATDAATREQWQELAILDEQVTHTDRRRVLLRLFAEQPGSVRLAQNKGCIEGFLAARPGHHAVQLGPCIASPQAGSALLADAWRCYAGQPVFLDIPVANVAATRLAEAQGLTVQRHLTRMCRGVPVVENLDWLWTGSGPEKG